MDRDSDRNWTRSEDLLEAAGETSLISSDDSARTRSDQGEGATRIVPQPTSSAGEGVEAAREQRDGRYVGIRAEKWHLMLAGSSPTPADERDVPDVVGQETKVTLEGLLRS